MRIRERWRAFNVPVAGQIAVGCVTGDAGISSNHSVANMRMPYRPSRRADAGMSTLRASTGMSLLSAGAGMSPLLAGAGMSSSRASNWQPLEYIETPVWP